MPNQNFWPCVKAMAAYLEGAWELEELTLDQLQNELIQLKSDERMERRREIMLIIAQLSRLEIRMTEEAPSVVLKKPPTFLKWVAAKQPENEELKTELRRPSVAGPRDTRFFWAVKRARQKVWHKLPVNSQET